MLLTITMPAVLLVMTIGYLGINAIVTGIDKAFKNGEKDEHNKDRK